jgi:hypothetical protein
MERKVLAISEGGPPHPGYFGKRGCKLLKTNDRKAKKRGKRAKEAANC